MISITTRSSATAEKHRVSCACLSRLANWSCNAQNTTVGDVVQPGYSQIVSAIRKRTTFISPNLPFHSFSLYRMSTR